MQTQDDKINEYLHGIKRNLINIQKFFRNQNTIDALKNGDTRGVTIGTMINYFEKSSEIINQAFLNDNLQKTANTIEKLQRELPAFIELLRSCEDIETLAEKVISKSNLLIRF